MKIIRDILVVFSILCFICSLFFIRSAIGDSFFSSATPQPLVIDLNFGSSVVIPYDRLTPLAILFFILAFVLILIVILSIKTSSHPFKAKVILLGFLGILILCQVVPSILFFGALSYFLDLAYLVLGFLAIMLNHH